MKRTDLGFSLIELLVVMAIFLIITSVILFNQDKASSDLSLSNVTYEIALKIRQTQTYGLLVKGTASEYDNAYGVHFYKDAGVIKFLVFADDPNPADPADLLVYDDPGDNPPLSYHTIADGNIISNVCTYASIGNIASKKCLLSGVQIATADIVFQRPESAAIIFDTSSASQKGEVDITVKSALGDKSRTIKVFGSGQISVYPN